ncbi:polysaccharide biosynthesis protein [Vibrio sp. MEBiC08052]|uniref:polysaccharide biosynthesis protein n=1 Tax=Vibrio sp. MEBiC08052 TaxID=1761910 RepID=UPI00074066E8|nr:nucleoside-diphosphate sugar epimerase/dehydratase [Vibrio sp. MEBiC08052]KUJ00627.1 UDP-N-acetylglucosamine 4,6-dehydratase [Vibrio sp. MEBiC08052]
MFTPIRLLLQMRRRHKRLISLIYDVCAVLFSLMAAMVLRLDGFHFSVGLNEIACTVLTIFVTIVTFIRFGMYRTVLRYMMLPAIGHIFFAVFLSSLALALSSYFFHAFVPRSVPFIYMGLGILLLGGPRIIFRTIYYHYYKRNKPNVFIYGAGATGRELAYALIHGNEYNPVALLDDSPQKIGQIIFGIRVHPSENFSKLNSLYQPVKLLLAINNISKGERLRLLDKLSEWPIEVQSVPSVEDIATGRADATEVQDLDIADLLGRAPIEPDPKLMSKNIHEKNVMVTGGGGSIGSELCRQILLQEPKTLILFELNEFNLYSINYELQSIKKRLKLDCIVIPILGSVQNKNRLQNILIRYNVDCIYHAAAYKHVPLVEENAIEGIRNNVFGTLICAQAAIESGVSHFTLISTDKAVRPTNIMGASKRLAELVLQSLADNGYHTNFTIVRFGNVLGSSGSVVPLFKEQIRKGGPVTVTHPDIIRYFMLIPEAAQLVIQASAMGINGQVFVLDMGEPIKILDLARRMINLMGMKEYYDSHHDDGDIEIRYTGLRPGEKLYEELLIGENVQGTVHPKIMTASEEKLSWDNMQQLLSKLDDCCHNYLTEDIIQLLLNAPIGYHPTQNKD